MLPMAASVFDAGQKEDGVKVVGVRLDELRRRRVSLGQVPLVIGNLRLAIEGGRIIRVLFQHLFIVGESPGSIAGAHFQLRELGAGFTILRLGGEDGVE